MSMVSAIYTGWVRHRRFSPKSSEFQYRVFMMYLSLEELEDVLKLSLFWSTSPLSLARFKREDFHGDPKINLSEAVKRTVEQELGKRPEGEVRVLANLRYFGFNMNPLVTYYCFDKSGERVDAILAEVTNTPWNERRAYVLRCDPDKAKQKIDFEKDFTVSPFNTVDMQYRWLSSLPSEKLFLHIDTMKNKNKITDATLHLKREPITRQSLHKILLRYPFMTVGVAVGIYWQALRLFLRGVPFLGKNRVSHQKLESDRYEIH